jgi:hypothetical protein
MSNDLNTAVLRSKRLKEKRKVDLIILYSNFSISANLVL